MYFYDKETYMIPKWVFVAAIFRLESGESHSNALTNSVHDIDFIAPKVQLSSILFLRYK